MTLEVFEFQHNPTHRVIHVYWDKKGEKHVEKDTYVGNVQVDLQLDGTTKVIFKDRDPTDPKSILTQQTLYPFGVVNKIEVLERQVCETKNWTHRR